MSTGTTAMSQAEGLRERHTVQTKGDDASNSSGQNTPPSEQDGEKEKKTFGRTPNGTSTSLIA